MEVLRTERGWAGHFISANQCMFRRNTLLECNGRKWVVSTVGNYIPDQRLTEPVAVGAGRWYETMAFEADIDSPYLDADVCSQISFDSQWGIFGNSWKDVYRRCNGKPDLVANLMHEKVVEELTEKIWNW